MPDELERSVELLERLLGDPHLRRRFRTDAATVLTEAGLPELAAGLGHGGRALMTLEMRESRSSLAGVMVAAAAEGVDLAQFAEHAAPALARDADAAVQHLMAHPHHPAPAPVPHAAPPQAAKPSFAPPAETPTLAPPEPKAGPTPAGVSMPDTGSAAPTAPTAPAQPEAASAAHPAAMQTPAQGARLVTGTEAAGRHHGGQSWRVGSHHRWVRVSLPITSPPITSPRAPRPHRRRLTRPTPDRRTLAIRPPPSSSRPGWARARRRPACRRSSR